MQKSDIGFYDYASTQPHAVTSVSQLSGDAFSTKYNKITYNSFNSVAKAELSATQGGTVSNTYTLTYGPDNQRRISNSDGAETIYTGLYEVRSNGNKLHYIPTPDGLCGLIVTNGATQTNYYLHNDHLGSLVAAEAQNGTLTEFSYDPWGRRRSSTNWNDYNVTIPTLFTRGFTGHEHMDAYGLINMNGRVYDPRLGRMLSPDKLVQAPDYSQSYNRYTYCFNNPLMLTDPSGWEGEPLGYYDNGAPFWTTTDAYYYYEVNKRGMNGYYNGGGPTYGGDMATWYMGDGVYLTNDQHGDLIFEMNKNGYGKYGSIDASYNAMKYESQYGSATRPPTFGEILYIFNAPSAANGGDKLTQSIYGAYNQNGMGGLSIQLGYNDQGTGLTNYRWVQTIRTNVPLGGATSPYNDPQPADDNLPFYWTNAELPSYQNRNGFDLIFSDQPKRLMQNGTWWRAELSVVGMNGSGTYVPIQTISYGFEIRNNAVTIYPITTITPSVFHLSTF